MQRGVGSLLRYEDFVQVGEGAYGHVYRARDKQGGPGPEAKTGAGQGGSGRVALKRLIVPPGSSESAGVSE
jgi:serine/threonine protein kinase